VALTDDQKAMLKLLAQREEGYEDMAAVMGISVEEVRERVKEALAEVDEPEAATEEAPEPPAAPTPPPTPPAPAPESPRPTAEVALAAPSATAAVEPAATASKTPPSGPGPGGLRSRMPKDRGALIGLGAGVLVVLIFAIVLIVAGGGDGSDSSTTAGSAETGQGGTTPTAAESESLTEAILSPTDGGDASGKALFGRYKKSVLLQVEADGLAPSPSGQSYAIWLYRSPKVALQIGAVPVTGSGKIATQFKIPAQLLAYIASGAFNQIDISLISNATYKAAFEKAKKENRLPPYSGESVLRGKITGPAIKGE
jgi:hypothetical protein